MVRIGGGVFPEIKEKDYLGNGQYRVDAGAGKVSMPLTPMKQAYMSSIYLMKTYVHCSDQMTEHLFMLCYSLH